MTIFSSFFLENYLLYAVLFISLVLINDGACNCRASHETFTCFFFFFLGSTGSGERGAFGLRRLADRELQFIRKQEATNNKQNRRTPYGQLVLSGDQRKSIFFLLAKAPGE
jgi:hypothetical protein